MEKLVKGLALTVVAATLPLFSNGEVIMTRSMEVERLSATTFKVECQIKYRGVDSTATYDAVLIAGGTDVENGTPYDGVVSPSNPEVSFTDQVGGVFYAKLTSTGQLFIKRVFTHSSQTLPSHFYHGRHCQGGALNMSTGVHLPAVTMYDYQQP